MRSTVRIDEEGRLEVKPTERLAILWSFDPVTIYKPPHQMVGSVLAHTGHLAIRGAVYWNLLFTVSEALAQFNYPLSGYLYSSSLKLVQYRARVVDMSPGPRKEFMQYVPMWRTADTKNRNLFILIDQIDELVPPRPITDFFFFENDRPLESPPSGNYFRVRDPLY